MKPTILWFFGRKDNKKLDGIRDIVSEREKFNSTGFAKVFLGVMYNFKIHQDQQFENYKGNEINLGNHELSKYDKTPGVYFF